MQPKVIKNGHTYTHTHTYPDDTSSNMLLEDISLRTKRKRNTDVISGICRLRWEAVEMSSGWKSHLTPHQKSALLSGYLELTATRFELIIINNCQDGATHVSVSVWNPGWMRSQSTLPFIHFSHLSWAHIRVLISSQTMQIKRFFLPQTGSLWSPTSLLCVACFLLSFCCGTFKRWRWLKCLLDLIFTSFILEKMGSIMSGCVLYCSVCVCSCMQTSRDWVYLPAKWEKQQHWGLCS